MKKIFTTLLAVTLLFSMVACDSAGSNVSGNGATTAPGAGNEPQAKNVGESFVTDNFTLTVSDFQFVSSANFGDYSYDYEDIITGTPSSDTVIAYFRFSINNTGANTYNLLFSAPALVSGDIRYDGSANGVAKYYCITTDDASSSVSPLENKEYNYCIFNIPAAMMSQSSLALEFELDGVTYTYIVK